MACGWRGWVVAWGLGWMVAAFPAQAAQASGVRLEVPTREGVSVSLFWEPAAPGDGGKPGGDVQAARGTVLLFPGAGGGFGRVEDGRATSRNFLVRSAGEFVARGYDVAIFGKPSDRGELGYADRIAPAHLDDVHAVLAFVRARSPGPVWLVGTSRGTVSAAAAAIREGDAIAGLVLTSSIVAPDKPGSLPRQDLAAIRVPVLVLHHARDECRVTSPREVGAILRGLTAAPVKKLMLVDGGGPPSGEPCEALHWHGFIGMEAEAVQLMTGWMEKPEP
jgi:pimeloyl-ACP methyl ester carboxylesterase